MPEHPMREYLVKVCKSWGVHISGPVLALAAIILAILAAIYADDPGMGIKIIRSTAWSLGSLAFMLFFVAGYDVWKKEREEHNKAEMRLRPRMKLGIPQSHFWIRGQEGGNPGPG